MRDKSKNDQQTILKVNILNPEDLPKARERFTKFAYESYMEALKEDCIKSHIDEND